MDKVLGDLRQWNETLDLNDGGFRRRPGAVRLCQAIPRAFLGSVPRTDEVVGRGAAPLRERLGAFRRSRDSGVINPLEHHDDATVRNVDCCRGAIRKIATGDVITVARSSDLTSRTTVQPECSSRQGTWLWVSSPVDLRDRSDGTELEHVALHHRARRGSACVSLPQHGLEATAPNRPSVSGQGLSRFGARARRLDMAWCVICAWSSRRRALIH